MIRVILCWIWFLTVMMVTIPFFLIGALVQSCELWFQSGKDFVTWLLNK